MRVANDKDGNGIRKLVGLGQIALGVGFILKGIVNARGGVPARVDALGQSSRPAQAPGRILKTSRLEKVRNIDERVQKIQELIHKGSLNPEVREKAVEIVTKKCGDRWCVAEKNFLGEVSAVFWALRDPRSPDAIRYVRDHVKVDQFHGADKILKMHAGDCFVKGTLVLRDDHQLVPVEALRAGDRIWGLNCWSTVTQTWVRGYRKTSLIRLNNGSTMRLTPEHKVWVRSCSKHGRASTGSDHCLERTCPMAERELLRVPVSDLRPGDIVVRPSRIPFGRGEQDGRRAYVEGLFLSDGWCEDYRFAISGKDGHPKEAQKRAVAEICTQLGVDTSWQARFIRVNDPEWTRRMALMGGRAPEKHALSIDLAEGPALKLLEGILADSGENTLGGGRTFTTTSRQLFVQARVLLKMAGATCGERYIVDHGGLGTHPIWRLQIWGGRKDGRAEKALRVVEVLDDEREMDTIDFETDDHFAWLPEADWTTSQCDDGNAILAGALLQAIGYPVKLRVIQTTDSSTWSHIYALAGLPPTKPTRWLPFDWSVTDSVPGWEAPGAKEAAATGKPAGIVTRVRDFNV